MYRNMLIGSIVLGIAGCHHEQTVSKTYGKVKDYRPVVVIGVKGRDDFSDPVLNNPLIYRTVTEDYLDGKLIKRYLVIKSFEIPEHIGVTIETDEIITCNPVLEKYELDNEYKDHYISTFHIYCKPVNVTVSDYNETYHYQI